jgi:hypothetical protein
MWLSFAIIETLDVLGSKDDFYEGDVLFISSALFLLLL